jgi:hypothetical protein
MVAPGVDDSAFSVSDALVLLDRFRVLRELQDFAGWDSEKFARLQCADIFLRLLGLGVDLVDDL